MKASRADTARAVQAEGRRATGRACNARPRASVSVDSAKVQRCDGDWISERKERDPDTPGIVGKAKRIYEFAFLGERILREHRRTG